MRGGPRECLFRSFDAAAVRCSSNGLGRARPAGSSADFPRGWRRDCRSMDVSRSGRGGRRRGREDRGLQPRAARGASSLHKFAPLSLTLTGTPPPAEPIARLLKDQVDFRRRPQSAREYGSRIPTHQYTAGRQPVLTLAVVLILSHLEI